MTTLGVIIVVQFILFYRIFSEIDNIHTRTNNLNKEYDYKLYVLNKKMITPEKKGEIQHNEAIGVFIRSFSTPRFKTKHKLEKGEWFKNKNEFYKVVELIDVEINEKVVNDQPKYVYEVKEIKEDL